MQRIWRFLDTGSSDAAWNMALDEAIWRLHEAQHTPPTLRLYAWDAPTLSLGYAQNAVREVDRTACEAHGVAVVRRPTGGRAVLHDHEVTYSVVLPLTENATLSADYHEIAMALAAAFRLVGLPVRLARPQVRAPRALASPACFAALSRYELSVDGRKLVGSAQKRGKRAFLQHGAIPLAMDRTLLFHCLRVAEMERSFYIHEAHATMVAVNEILAEPLTPSTLGQALRQGFATACGVTFVETPLLSEEVRLAHELASTKYGTDAWNFGGAAVWRQAVASPAL